MFLLLQACSLFKTVDRLECSVTADCIDTFGFGNTCLSDGYCARVEPIPRCETTNPPDFWNNPIAYKDAFVMGQMFDFDADASKLAASALAFNDILETGTSSAWLDGRPLVQITCNYENSAGDLLTEKEAVESVTDFLVDTMGVEVIVGPAGSQDSLYAINLSNDRALFISPSATAEVLKPIDSAFSDDDPGFFWRTTGPDNLQSKRLETYLRDTELNNVAILYQANIYGRGIGTTLRDLRTQYTGTTPATDTFEINNPSSIPGKINALLNDGSIEALVFISDSTDDLMQAVTTMRASAYERLPLLLTDSAAKTELLSDLQAYTGGNAELEASIVSQIKGTKPSVPSSDQYNEFISRLNSLHGVDAQTSAFTAHSYDATWLAATALLYAHENEDPHDITGLARGLRKLSDTEQPPVELSTSGWNQLKDRLSSNESVNILGTSGDLDYDPTTEELTTSVDLWQIAEDLTTFEIIEDDTDTENTDDTSDTGDTGDVGDTGDTGSANTLISPDTIQITFKHGYDSTAVSDTSKIVSIAYSGTTTAQDGDLSISLIDSTTGQSCGLRWNINSGTVLVDSSFQNGILNGSLVEGVSASEVGAWFGYIINDQPTVGISCNDLDTQGAQVLAQLQQGSPGFGYAPLNANFSRLYTDIVSNHPAGWSTIEDSILVGLVSFTAFSNDGSKRYYPINQTFIYKMITSSIPWTTHWDPNHLVIPQSNTLVISGWNSPSGFYVSESYFNFEAPLQ